MAALAEGDATWTEGVDHPTQQEIQNLTDVADQMVQGCLSLTRAEGIRVGRRIYSVILAVDELKYYDLFPILTVIQTVLKLPVAHAGRIGGT